MNKGRRKTRHIHFSLLFLSFFDFDFETHVASFFLAFACVQTAVAAAAVMLDLTATILLLLPIL